MMDYVFMKNDIAWLKMWMLLLLMISIYVKTHVLIKVGFH
jgi:hypothetical protein